MNNTEYNTFKNNVILADNIERISQLENSLNNLFKNGIFTPEQFGELDCLIMDKLAGLGA